MIFGIGALHVKGREWKAGKGRSRGLLLKHGIGRGGKREGTGREERRRPYKTAFAFYISCSSCRTKTPRNAYQWLAIQSIL